MATTGSSVLPGLEGFGIRLYDVITHLGLSQNEFAQRVGCSPSFISNMVRGEKVPGSEFLWAVKRVFDVSLDWLVAGDGSMFGTGRIDLDLFRLVAALVELARRWEVEGDVEAEILGRDILSGSVHIDSLPMASVALLREYEGASKASAFCAVLYGEHLDAHDSQARVVSVLTSALAHAQVSRPFIVQKTLDRSRERVADESAAPTAEGQTQQITGQSARRGYIEIPGLVIEHIDEHDRVEEER